MIHPPAGRNKGIFMKFFLNPDRGTLDKSRIICYTVSNRFT